MALNNVPLSGQTLAGTRVPINTNFQLINNAFLVDHVEYNIANQGMHAQVQLTLKPAGAVVLTPTNGFFSQNYATTTKDELFVQAAAGAGTAQYPMTASVLSANPTAADSSPGWTFLPSGILMKWGTATITSGGTAVSLAATGPAFGAVFAIEMTPTGSVNPSSNTISAFTTASFTAYSSVATAVVLWVAIGRP